VTFSHCKKGDTFTLQEQEFQKVRAPGHARRAIIFLCM